MFTRLSFLVLLALSISLSSCQEQTTTKDEGEVVETIGSPITDDAPFSVLVELDNSKTHLPTLQSFVLATANDTWLMFAGRTNGMHKFADYEKKSFPPKLFNHTIFVCDASKCDSMPITSIPMPYRSMFRATNLQHLQEGNDLYITGGYGESFDASLPDKERWDTYSFIAKIDVAAMIAAVQAKDAKALNASMTFGQHDAVRATGGELFKMGDYFYLTVGHKYSDLFGKGNQTQVYLDAVHRFTVSESGGELTIGNFTKITDGFPDDSTQFRRRDLPVAKTLRLVGGQLEPAITLYAGVFTTKPTKIKGLTSQGPFTNPIHIYQDGSHALDATYAQTFNVYACANFVVYDANSSTVHTTLLGGIGDNTKKVGFTKNVLTINQSLDKGKITTETTQASMTTTNHFGAEANMILANGNKVAGSNSVFDISSMKSGDVLNIGSFYGGIEAITANPGGYGAGLSGASSKVFKVSITKN